MSTQVDGGTTDNNTNISTGEQMSLTLQPHDTKKLKVNVKDENGNILPYTFPDPVVTSSDESVVLAETLYSWGGYVQITAKGPAGTSTVTVSVDAGKPEGPLVATLDVTVPAGTPSSVELVIQ